ncbi:PilT protein domain protein [Ammonifex degensii KC4]|uniref:PilT protein domain protein n=1 Tax=Ammonifex degensii (strain DSM 10501 / KC4) TaxID=429009 RepID=C9RD60_AMMDK|nr:PIN domain-containing protein [Ammonifex degensii]ACX52187.1 PilT protein domain protein [Ammonifex degensii KC4]
MKKPRVLDANIILRFLTSDAPEQADRCAKLLKRVEAGTEEVWLPELVLADIVWTLEKFYRQPKERIRELLTLILNLRGLRHANKKVAKEALRLYVEKNVDWTDAFVAAQMFSHKQCEIYSYDRDFDRIEGIIRLEP